jgi:hypothetical protein
MTIIKMKANWYRGSSSSSKKYLSYQHLAFYTIKGNNGRSDDIANLSQDIDSSNGDCSFLRCSAHGIGCPGGDERIGEIHSADKDEGCCVSGVSVGSDEADDVADTSYPDWTWRSVGWR